MRAGRARAVVGPGNVRVADAAKAAADGLRGVRRIEGPRTEGSARAPGVGVLFDPVAPVGSRPMSEPAEASDRAGPVAASERSVDVPGRHVGDPAEDTWPTEQRAAGSTTADVGVWNPFRQPRRPEPRAPAARPEIGNLHTRATPTGINVIATLVHRGRLCHGTAVGSASGQGRSRAVAEATVAALRIVADEPLPVGVDRIRWTDDDPARVEVVLTWANGSGEEALIGTAVAHGAPDDAIMQATLDALGRRLEQLARTTPQR